MASAEGSQRSQDDTDTQTQLTVLSESQQAQQGMDRLAQQPGPGLSLQAQQGLPPGGLLIKPKPVGIGHMCRAISTLTGGILTLLTPPCPSLPLMHLIKFSGSSQFLIGREAI